MRFDRASEFAAYIRERHPGGTADHEAVEDVVSDVWETYACDPQHVRGNILERLTEPDRIISFRVTWEVDDGSVHVNRGTRVQQNNAIGPSKGGIRFHPTVTPDVLKFLAFEQTFQNALAGLPMGGGKGRERRRPRIRHDPRTRQGRQCRRRCRLRSRDHAGPRAHAKDAPRNQ